MSRPTDRKPRGRLRKTVWGAAALLWLLALAATQLTTEVSWNEAIGYGVILSAAAGICELALALRTRPSAYRTAAVVALSAMLLLGWVNGAVGIIGSEDQPANLLYGGVIAIGLIGVVLARFRPRGIARALLVMALAQALVPVIALILWPAVSWGAAGRSGVFALNGFFAVWFAGSSLLFGRAANLASPAESGT